MKIYACILAVTKEEKSTIIGLGSPKSTLDWKYHKDEDLWCVFYGWTQNKKYMKEFKQTRNKKLFRYIIITDPGKIEFIMDRYMDLKIEKYSLKIRSDKERTVIMTWFEFLATTDQEFLSEHLLLGRENYCLDPLVFNKNCLRILEQIGYSDLFYSYFTDLLPFKLHPLEDISKIYESGKTLMDMETRLDNHCGCSSFVQNHHYTNEIGIPARFAKWNQLNCFIKIFGELLKI